MLRHLLMTPPPEPRRVLPRRLQSLAHDVIRPLYYYVVPHRVPKRHELEIICTCRYPLFTLCTPRTSPYDVTDKEQNVSSETNTLNSTEAVQEVGSHVMGEFPLKVELSTFKKINNKLKDTNESNNMIKCKEDYINKQCKRRRVVENDIEGGHNTSVSCNVETLHSSSQNNNKTQKEALQEKEKEPLEHQEEYVEEEESNNRLFQVKARGMRRLRWSRTILHSWELWRKQHTTYMQTIHPNVIPGRPACYRCDICDGFQSTDNSKNTSTPSKTTSRYTSSLNTSNRIASNDVNEMKHEMQSQIAANENKMENMQLNNNVETDREFTSVSDHHVGRLIEPQSPLQSTIAAMVNKESGKEENTKQIAQVAQLRYLDPFRVEVHHRPPLASLAFNLMRQFYAQLRRCGIHVHELSKQVKYVPLNSTRNARYFDSWVKQERKRRFHMLQSSSTKDKIQYYAHGVHLLEGASYAIRFAVAVYGLPYELGYFNSVQGLLKLQAEPHCRYVYATSQEQMDSMKRMLHGDGLHSEKEYEFALSRYSVNVNEASFAVVIDHTMKIVIVTFRGTLTLADAVVDIMEGYVNVNLCRESLHANQEHLSHTQKEMKSNDNKDKTKDTTSTLHTRIPVGFFESVRNAALTLVPALNAIFEQHKDYVLYITGHSLGAVQASLFHLLYCTSSITMAVVDDPQKAALMPSERHKTDDQEIQESEETYKENRFCEIQQDETNVDNINESTDKNNLASSSSSEEAITDALIKVKCNKVHTFAFAPAPMMEVNILPKLHELLHQEEYYESEEEEMQNERICGNSLSSFVYGQDPVSRVDVRSFVNVFAPSNSAKNETILPSVANAEICKKTKCEENSNETSATVLSAKRKVTNTNNNNNNSSMSFDIADACVPTLGIPGNLYCIPHTSRRCFFNVNVQAQWRKQLILTPEAMVHHFPVHYLRAVNKLRMHYTNQLNALRVMEHQTNECSTEKNVNEQVSLESQKMFSQG